MNGLTRRRMLAALAVTGMTPALAATDGRNHGRSDPARHLASRGGARIDPSAVQILFADLQPSIVAGSKTVSPRILGRSAATLAEVAAILEIPALFSIVPEGDRRPALIEEIQPFATQSNTLLRTLTGPFMDPPTAAALASNERRTLVISGFSAEVVVLQAVLDALASGYTVHYVVDAIGGRSERTEAAAFRAIELAGGLPTTVTSLTTRMAPDLFNPPGSEAFKAVLKLRSP